MTGARPARRRQPNQYGRIGPVSGTLYPDRHPFRPSPRPAPIPRKSMEKGTMLAHYRVEEKIGKGGMGEVYRAHDTKLDRDVALKILPAEFAADRERLARFQREAKVLASLNHPNIASIYGFEKTRRPHLPGDGAGRGRGPVRAPRSRARCPWTRPSTSPARSPRASRRPTRRASSTATSSPPTSSSRPTAR